MTDNDNKLFEKWWQLEFGDESGAPKAEFHDAALHFLAEGRKQNNSTLPKLGMPFGGGFFGGELVVNDERFALILAPKATGEKMNLQNKKKSLNKADGTDSDDEGFYNTELNNNANHPAAQFCRALRIGEHDDWYLPSRDELMTIWMALGPNRKKTPEPFKAGGSEAFAGQWYWSSTEHARNSNYAWMVYFSNGFQNNLNKNSYNGVRAVRRLQL